MLRCICTAQARQASIQIRYDQVRAQVRELRNQARHEHRIESSQFISETGAGLLINETDATPQALNQQPEPALIARSVISLLPRLNYKEQLEATFERSLEYVQVQRMILRAIEKYDTALTAKEAYEWTCEIDPRDRIPQPLQALRLCYYMRSLGFDTYASIVTTYIGKPGREALILRLLVVNRDSHVRGPGHDYLYWAQDIQTDAKLSKAYEYRQAIEEAMAGSPRPILTLNTSRCPCVENCQ